MSAFDAVIGEFYWGCGETAEEAVYDAFTKWTEESEKWHDNKFGWQAEVYEHALFESSNNPDQDGGFLLTKWKNKGFAVIDADEEGEPTVLGIVWPTEVSVDNKIEKQCQMCNDGGFIGITREIACPYCDCYAAAWGSN